MKPGLHRPDRDIQPDGDIHERQIGPVMEEDDREFVRVQDRKVAEHRVALEHGGERVRHRSLWGSLDRHEPHDLPPPQPVPAAVDEDPVEPGPESVRVSQRTEGPPRRGERFLDRLLGLARAPEQETREPVGSIEPR